MGAFDPVQVIRKLEVVQVEMSWGAGAAVSGEAASHARNQQEVRNCAVHVGSQVRPIDSEVCRPAIVTPAIEPEVSRINQLGRERIDIADGRFLSQLKVSGRSARE